MAKKHYGKDKFGGGVTGDLAGVMSFGVIPEQ